MNSSYWPIYQMLLFPFSIVVWMSFYACFLFKSLKYKKRPKNKKSSRNELKDIFNKKVEFSLACIILLFCLTSGVYQTFDLINKDFQEIGGNIKKIENAYRNPFSQEITIENNNQTVELYVRRIDVKKHSETFRIGKFVHVEFAKRTNIILKAN